MLSFDEKSISDTLLGSPYWDDKPANAILAESPGVYTSDNFLYLSTKKTRLKCDAIDGSVKNGIRGPILFSFISDKPPGHKVF